MKRKKILLLIIGYLIFFCVGLFFNNYTNNPYLIYIGRYLLGFPNIIIGIIGLIESKEKKYWPAFIAFLFIGIIQIINNSKNLFLYSW